MFEGTDFVLLSYSSAFHSQSGVLNIAARARKPVLASSAPGPLVEAVSRFKLGMVVQPDSGPEIVRGIRELMTSGVQPGWSEYEAYAGWAVNVHKLLAALETSLGGPLDDRVPLAPNRQTADVSSEARKI